MLMLSFFSWWYGQGWHQVVTSFKPRLKSTTNLFSVNQLLRTLFAPWRRIISYPGSSLEDRVKAWGDNLVSRAIGFVVRLFVLVAAFITLLCVMCLTLAEIVIWPLLPLAVPIFIIVGIAI